MTTRSATTRLIMFLSLALALGVSGCGTGDLVGVNQGNVQFVVSSSSSVTTAAASQGPAATNDDDHDDDHRARFVSANVTFSSILARDLDGILSNVEMELPTTLDVMTMEGGRAITLPDGELPPGTYDQVVLVMREVEGVLRDGTTITITPPGGGWTAIVPTCPFIVEDGETAVVGLMLSVGKSFKWRNNRFHFEPSFESETETV